MGEIIEHYCRPKSGFFVAPQGNILKDCSNFPAHWPLHIEVPLSHLPSHAQNAPATL
jgi:hypothetical protein